MIFLQIFIGVGGCFLLLWSITLQRMSLAQRPRFCRKAIFRWGVSLVGWILVLIGFGLAVQRSLLGGGLGLAASLICCWLLLRHDQYSAMTRILYDDYFALKNQNPQSEDFDLLYSIVKSRYPRWNEDRMTEVCTGKDIKQLVLLLMVMEYEIHPLYDMALYQSLKEKVERLYPQL